MKYQGKNADKKQSAYNVAGTHEYTTYTTSDHMTTPYERGTPGRRQNTEQNNSTNGGDIFPEMMHSKGINQNLSSVINQSKGHDFQQDFRIPQDGFSNIPSYTNTENRSFRSNEGNPQNQRNSYELLNGNFSNVNTPKGGYGQNCGPMPHSINIRPNHMEKY